MPDLLTDPSGAPARPLVVTEDPDLLDLVLHLAAVADVEVQVAGDVAAARSIWAGAPCVLVGADLAGAVVRAGLAPHRSILVVRGGAARDPGGVEVARVAATALGAGVAELPAQQDRVLDYLVSRPGPAAVGHVVSVVGGRGGAGATTLACALAVSAAAAGQRSMLVDADPLGGGVDLVLGAEDLPGLRWGDLTSLHGPVAAQALVGSLPAAHGVAVLSHGRGNPELDAPPTAAMAAVLDAATAVHDLVVVDVSRHLDAAAEEALRSSDRTVLVVPAEVRATAAAARVLAAVGGLAGHLRVVVRGPAPSGLRARTVATMLGRPEADWLRPEPGLAQALERGEPPGGSGRGPLVHLCRALLEDLAADRSRAAA